MTGIEINERTEMFDMHGQVPAAYPPGHVYIIGEHEPELSVLSYVIEQMTKMRVMYYCICGAKASLWEKQIRDRLGKACEINNVSPMKIRHWLWSAEKKDDPNASWKNNVPPGSGEDFKIAVCSDPKEMAEDIAAQFVGRFQPKCYVAYDDRDLAFEIQRWSEDYVREYRGLICETLEKFGTFEFGYFGKDFVISLDDDNRVMLGQLGREVTCDTLEEALDLPVFSDWTMLHLWNRLQGIVGHWMKEKQA